MKNGVNSAKRYTNAHIRDYRRQLAIDVLTSGRGSTTTLKTEELNTQYNSESSGSSSSGEEEDESGGKVGTSQKVN